MSMRYLTGELEKQPASMTKENLLKALLMGKRNDDPLKYKQDILNVQNFTQPDVG